MDEQRHTETLSQKLLDAALKKVRRAVKGNGIDPELVSIESYDGCVHVFNTKTILDLKPIIAKRTVPGRNTQAELLQSAHDIQSKIDSHIHNAVTSPSIRQNIIDSYTKNDESKGFAAKAQRITLDTLKRDYVLPQDCQTCNKQGKVTCKNCNATGYRTCNHCSGRRKVTCQKCNGQRTKVIGGIPKPCQACRGQGQVNCYTCHGKGTVQCRSCNTKGYRHCETCAGTGQFSIIHHVDIEATSRFECEDINALPEQIPPYLVNEKQRALFSKEAKTTNLVEDKSDFVEYESTGSSGLMSEEEKKKKAQSRVIIPFEVRCPLAELRLNVAEENYSGKILGYRPLFNDYTNFIEELCKEPIARVDKASKSRRGARIFLKRAIKASLVKEALSLTIRTSNMNAFRQMKRIYPLGISDSTLKSLIINLRKTIRNITILPRTLGVISSSIVSIGLWYAYHIWGKHYTAPIPAQFDLIIDAVPLILAIYTSTIFTKIKSRFLLKDFLDTAELNALKANIGPLIWSIPVFYISAIIALSLYSLPQNSWPYWFSMLRPYLPL